MTTTLSVKGIGTHTAAHTQNTAMASMPGRTRFITVPVRSEPVIAATPAIVSMSPIAAAGTPRWNR